MYLLFNIGGTNTRVAISEDGKSLSEVLVEKTPDNSIGGCRLILEMGEKLANDNKFDAIAGGIAGVWDRDRKVLLKSPNLPGWEGKISLPGALFENDAAMEALGEASIGAGRRRKILAYLCVGTGIGGCRIVNGKIDDREVGFEPGQMIINYNKRIGYLEEFASGKSIAKLGNMENIWENEARLISIALHNMTVLWSPEMIVLGGSVIKSVDIELVKKYLKEEMKIFPSIPEIVESELGDKSGLYGALELIRQKTRF